MDKSNMSTTPIYTTRMSQSSLVISEFRDNIFVGELKDNGDIKGLIWDLSPTQAFEVGKHLIDLSLFHMGEGESLEKEKELVSILNRSGDKYAEVPNTL